MLMALEGPLLCKKIISSKGFERTIEALLQLGNALCPYLCRP